MRYTALLSRKHPCSKQEFRINVFKLLLAGADDGASPLAHYIRNRRNFRPGSGYALMQLAKDGKRELARSETRIKETFGQSLGPLNRAWWGVGESLHPSSYVLLEWRDEDHIFLVVQDSITAVMERRRRIEQEADQDLDWKEV